MNMYQRCDILKWGWKRLKGFSTCSLFVHRILQTSPERDKISSAIKRGKNIQKVFLNIDRVRRPQSNVVLFVYVSGNEAELRKLTGRQSAFSEQDSSGQIPLHEAAMQNNQRILEITFKGQERNYLMFQWATWQYDLKRHNTHIRDKHVSVSWELKCWCVCSTNLFDCSTTASPTDAKFRTTRRGKTALFLAIEKGLLENASYLLDNGSSPDCLDSDEDSLLVIGQYKRNQRYIFWSSWDFTPCWKCMQHLVLVFALALALRWM